VSGERGPSGRARSPSPPSPSRTEWWRAIGMLRRTEGRAGVTDDGCVSVDETRIRVVWWGKAIGEFDPAKNV
jgi:hypothetical protein